MLGLALLGLMIGLMENELMWHNRNIPVMSFQLIKLLNLGITAILFYFVLRFARFSILGTREKRQIISFILQVLLYRIRTAGGFRQNCTWCNLLAGSVLSSCQFRHMILNTCTNFQAFSASGLLTSLLVETFVIVIQVQSLFCEFSFWILFYFWR